MKKYLYALFLLMLLFDGFFIYTIIRGYNNLEEKTAWVQEAYIGGKGRKSMRTLEILPVYDPKFLKFPPDEPYYSSDGFNKWKEYEKFLDSLRKNTKELYYPKNTFLFRSIEKPHIGEQIFFYQLDNKYNILKNHHIEMIGYYPKNERKTSNFSVFIDVAHDYLWSGLGLVSFLGLFLRFSKIPFRNNFMDTYSLIKILVFIVLIFLK